MLVNVFWFAVLQIPAHPRYSVPGDNWYVLIFYYEFVHAFCRYSISYNNDYHGGISHRVQIEGEEEEKLHLMLKILIPAILQYL